MQALGGHYGYKTDHAGEEDLDSCKRRKQSGGGIQDGKGRSDGGSARIHTANAPRLYPHCGRVTAQKL